MARTKSPFAGDPPADPAPPQEAESGKSAPEGGSGWTGDRLRVPPDPERDLACARLPLTDLGNAERWRVRHGRNFRFRAELGWLAWDGRRWKLLSEEKDALPARVMQSVFLTVRAIRNEAALVAASGYPPMIGMSDRQLMELQSWTEAARTSSYDLYLAQAARAGHDEGAIGDWLRELEPMDVVLGKDLWSSKIAAWAKTSEGAAKLGAIAKLAKAFPDVAIEPGDLDRDRMAINVLNGTLRLHQRNVKRSAAEVRAGKSVWRTEWALKLEPHARGDLNTKLAPVEYNPRKKCPVYDAFMLWAQPEEAMRRFVHQWGGLSLTGDIGEQKLAFFYGQGGNGKGTWVELVAHVAGDYAGSVGIETFLDTGIKRRGDQATPDLARLPGVRFLRVSEPEKNSRLNEGLIKMVTGGDPVDARHLNKGFFSFLPSFKMTISGNHKPKVKDTSKGIWRRMQLVPWNASLKESEVDVHLVSKLQAEASGVLNRLLEGLLDWRAHGLIVPEEVRQATRAYQDESDQLGRFLHDLCEVGDDPLRVRVKASELWDHFVAWVDAVGAGEWRRKGFVDAMREKGFEQKTSDGTWWLKVKLRPGVYLDDVKEGRWPEPDVAGGEASASGVDVHGGDGPDDGWVPPEERG